ncbi:hypothetical protein K504DRAFT_453946 [Pleomassaria siparia CBS 279.74]|uniref:F-box domain-containing protein n=1 Tax=Pleomassaria siparia CBS 279.74 TaxID=1314801 RepID=A0A6G1KDK9_9PLEO|nr:hypothetical protein K504DRAFT_453946 [Pleomassaria siparia CBS 279.74]
MPSFVSLPQELIELVVSFLDHPEILRITHVSKLLFQIAAPLLYREVDLRIDGPASLKIPHKHPKIDMFFFRVLDDTKSAKYVKRLRVGYLPKNKPPRWLRSNHLCLGRVSELQKDREFNKIISVIKDEASLSTINHAIFDRCYGAFVALLLLVLPSLCQLELHEHECQLDYLSNVLDLINSKQPPSLLSGRMRPALDVSFNFDVEAGVRSCIEMDYDDLNDVIHLPGIRKLNFHIPDSLLQRSRHYNPRLHPRPMSMSTPSIITTMILRHSYSIPMHLREILIQTPQLQSLTCDLWYDTSKTKVPYNFNQDNPWIDLGRWTNDLAIVKDTLKTLVISVEYCDSTKFFYAQPDVRKQLCGKLNLTGFLQLQTLEVPFPLVTGDPHFRIFQALETFLPASLRHLCLRIDMSNAQFLAGPVMRGSSQKTAGDSRDESRCLDEARMDLSYMFDRSLSLLDRLPKLESFSVWQPAEATLCWFDSQLQDLTTTCQKKSITARVIYPMKLRWKNQQHWNLTKVVTLFDRLVPDRGRFEQLFRGQRDGGIPLGLAMQYLLSNSASELRESDTFSVVHHQRHALW